MQSLLSSNEIVVIFEQDRTKTVRHFFANSVKVNAPICVKSERLHKVQNTLSATVASCRVASNLDACLPFRFEIPYSTIKMAAIFQFNKIFMHLTRSLTKYQNINSLGYKILSFQGCCDTL